MKPEQLIKLCDYNAEAIKQPNHVNKHMMKAALQIEQMSEEDKEEFELAMLRVDYIRCVEKYGYATVWNVIE